MIIILLLATLCLYLFNRYRNKLEIREYREDWKPLKFSVAQWLVILCIAFLPGINLIGLFLFELITILDMEDRYFPDTRFKEGKSCILAKIIELMKKEF